MWMPLHSSSHVNKELRTPGTTCAIINMHAKGGTNRVKIPGTNWSMCVIAPTPTQDDEEYACLPGFQISTGSMIQQVAFTHTVMQDSMSSNVITKNAQ